MVWSVKVVIIFLLPLIRANEYSNTEVIRHRMKRSLPGVFNAIDVPQNFRQIIHYLGNEKHLLCCVQTFVYTLLKQPPFRKELTTEYWIRLVDTPGSHFQPLYIGPSFNLLVRNKATGGIETLPFHVITDDKEKTVAVSENPHCETGRVYMKEIYKGSGKEPDNVVIKLVHNEHAPSEFEVINGSGPGFDADHLGPKQQISSGGHSLTPTQDDEISLEQTPQPTLMERLLSYLKGGNQRQPTPSYHQKHDYMNYPESVPRAWQGRYPDSTGTVLIDNEPEIYRPQIKVIHPVPELRYPEATMNTFTTDYDGGHYRPQHILPGTLPTLPTYTINDELAVTPKGLDDQYKEKSPIFQESTRIVERPSESPQPDYDYTGTDTPIQHDEDVIKDMNYPGFPFRTTPHQHVSNTNQQQTPTMADYNTESISGGKSILDPYATSPPSLKSWHQETTQYPNTYSGQNYYGLTTPRTYYSMPTTEPNGNNYEGEDQNPYKVHFTQQYGTAYPVQYQNQYTTPSSELRPRQFQTQYSSQYTTQNPELYTTQFQRQHSTKNLKQPQKLYTTVHPRPYPMTYQEVYTSKYPEPYSNMYANINPNPTSNPTTYQETYPTTYKETYPTTYKESYPTTYSTTYPTTYSATYQKKYPSTYKMTYSTTNPSTNYPAINPTSYPATNPTNYPATNPTNYPEMYPVNYPATYPINYPEAYPTTHPVTYTTTYPTSHQTTYSTVYPTTYPMTYETTSQKQYPTNQYETQYPMQITTIQPDLRYQITEQNRRYPDQELEHMGTLLKRLMYGGGGNSDAIRKDLYNSSPHVMNVLSQVLIPQGRTACLDTPTLPPNVIYDEVLGSLEQQSTEFEGPNGEKEKMYSTYGFTDRVPGIADESSKDVSSTEEGKGDPVGDGVLPKNPNSKDSEELSAELTSSGSSELPARNNPTLSEGSDSQIDNDPKSEDAINSGNLPEADETSFEDLCEEDPVAPAEVRVRVKLEKYYMDPHLNITDPGEWHDLKAVYDDVSSPEMETYDGTEPHLKPFLQEIGRKFVEEHKNKIVEARMGKMGKIACKKRGRPLGDLLESALQTTQRPRVLADAHLAEAQLTGADPSFPSDGNYIVEDQHAVPRLNSDGLQSKERISDEHRSDEHRSDEHRSDEHLSDEHRSDEHLSDQQLSELSEERRADDHYSNEHRSDEHFSGEHLSGEHFSSEPHSYEYHTNEHLTDAHSADDEEVQSRMINTSSMSEENSEAKDRLGPFPDRPSPSDEYQDSREQEQYYVSEEHPRSEYSQRFSGNLGSYYRNPANGGRLVSYPRLRPDISSYSNYYPWNVYSHNPGQLTRQPQLRARQYEQIYNNDYDYQIPNVGGENLDTSYYPPWLYRKYFKYNSEPNQYTRWL